MLLRPGCVPCPLFAELPELLLRIRFVLVARGVTAFSVVALFEPTTLALAPTLPEAGLEPIAPALPAPRLPTTVAEPTAPAAAPRLPEK